MMQFLVLAYGREEDWKALTSREQQALLAQDAVLRDRGDLVAAVEPSVTVVRAPSGTAEITPGPFAAAGAPLAGFGIIDAADMDEAIRLVTDTPCARAGGAVEIRAIQASNDASRCAQRQQRPA